MRLPRERNEKVSGKIVCIGLGPGDPELMSVRADRLLRSAQRVAYFRKAGAKGQARSMVEGILSSDALEIAMEYPVTTEISIDDPRYNLALAEFYEQQTSRLLAAAEAGDLLVLCEGDPLFYGSFMHLMIRLPPDRVEVVPGIPGMVGCWGVLQRPMTWGDDILTVLPATLPEAELARRLSEADAVAVMKIGRNLEKLRRALQATGRLDQAWLVEFGTMPRQQIRRFSEVAGPVPYFSILLLHGEGRRP